MMMKKIFLLLFFTLASVHSFSQITRTIWGATLGKSTLQEVKTIVEQKGFEWEVDLEFDDYESLWINADHIPFGGAFWTEVAFYFDNDALESVVFNNVGTTANSIYEKIKKSLDSKYRQFFVDKPDDTGWSRYSDGKTRIGLKLDRSQPSGNKVILYYEDLYQTESTDQNGMDEL